MKKLLSLLLVVSMILALGIVAGATDDTNNDPTTYLQINNEDAAGSAGINFLVNSEKVTAQGSYRIFANVCYENVVPSVSGGLAYVNIYFYNEKDEFPAITNAGLASEPITVGKGQYFVLGDNRNNSEDSRHNGMGLVDSDRIVGKLWFTISPWKKIGFV